MNRYKKIGLILLTSLAGIYGCDKIKETEYYKPLTGSTERKVLLEDFTGHTCGYCPEVARVATNLRNSYGENLIVVAMHVGETFASPKNYPFQYDFTTSNGEEVNIKYNIDAQGLPKGMVNRKEFDGKTVLERGELGEKVANLLATRADMLLVFDKAAEYDSAAQTVKIDSIACKIVSTDIPLTDYKIQVYLLEDSIVRAQKDYAASPSTVLNYVHNHVFRASATGAFGEVFLKKEIIEAAKLTGTLRDKVFKSKPYKIPVVVAETKNSKGELIKGGWNPKKLIVVTFVSRADNNEVIQAEEVHVQ